ncbi:MAG: alpha/beta fold hydrolase [Planctomycetota bacterium]
MPPQNETAEIAEIGACGRGREVARVLVVPGVFESVNYAKALIARIRTDNDDDVGASKTRALLDRWTLRFWSVIPPGYERDPATPTNEGYGRRIAAAAANVFSATELKLLVCHSWGAAATALAAPLPQLADAAILSAPAWSDCATIIAKLGSWAFVVPLVRKVSHSALTATFPASLRASKVPAIKDLVADLPERRSSFATCFQSVRCVERGPRAAAGAAALARLARRSLIVHGGEDRAVNTDRALRIYAALDPVVRDSFEVLVKSNLTHFPLIEQPHLFAEILDSLV